MCLTAYFLADVSGFSASPDIRTLRETQISTRNGTLESVHSPRQARVKLVAERYFACFTFALASEQILVLFNLSRRDHDRLMSVQRTP